MLFITTAEVSCECHAGVSVGAAACRLSLASASVCRGLLSGADNGDGSGEQLAASAGQPFQQLPFADIHEALTLCGEDGELNARALLAQGSVLHDIGHREPAWLGASDKPRCTLEAAALEVFTYHIARFQLQAELGPSSGVEWWVRKCANDRAWWGGYEERSRARSKPGVNMDQGQGLGYNTDEGLYNAFATAISPALGTITHLSERPGLPASAVFLKSVHTPDADPIKQCLVAQPRLGKHVCFNGALLHGTSELLACSQKVGPAPSLDVDPLLGLSYTLHVNVWVHHRPVGIEPLPQPVLDELRGEPEGNQLGLQQLRLAPVHSTAVSEVQITHKIVNSRRESKSKTKTKSKSKSNCPTVKSVAIRCFPDEDDAGMDQEEEEVDGDGGKLSLLMWCPSECSGVQCNDRISSFFVTFCDDESAALLVDLEEPIKSKPKEGKKMEKEDEELEKGTRSKFI